MVLLAAMMVCIGARYYAAKMRRQYPPALRDGKGGGKGSPTSSSTNSGDIEEGALTPQVSLIEGLKAC